MQWRSRAAARVAAVAFRPGAALAETDVINLVNGSIPTPHILKGTRLATASRIYKQLRATLRRRGGFEGQTCPA